MTADSRSRRAVAALAAVGLIVAAAGGCAAVADPAPTRHETGAGFDAGAARAVLARLRVAPEDTGAHYRRADWPHWDRVAGDCDARAETLKDQGTGVTTGPHCRITGGRWTSRYDGVAVTDPGALDIDHMVPLAEAARSGTRGWTRAQRETYANDTRLVLVAVTAKSNRAKGDQDPAKWLPARDRCGYVAQWVAVKAKYAMTVDPAEHDAIAGILRRC